jgi:hypothetical protein
MRCKLSFRRRTFALATGGEQSSVGRLPGRKAERLSGADFAFWEGCGSSCQHLKGDFNNE